MYKARDVAILQRPIFLSLARAPSLSLSLSRPFVEFAPPRAASRGYSMACARGYSARKTRVRRINEECSDTTGDRTLAAFFDRCPLSPFTRPLERAHIMGTMIRAALPPALA